MRSLNNIILSPEFADTAVVAHEAGLEMLSRLELMTVQPKVIVNAMPGFADINEQLQQRYPEAKVVPLDTTLPAHSVDLLFANSYLPWQTDWPAVLREWTRLLAPEGLLMVSALGVDTLREWETTFQAENLPVRMDMHDLGDAMMHAGLSDPVLDVDYYDVNYRDTDRLLQDLQHSGIWWPETPPTISVESFPDKQNDLWTLTYEVIIAHAFGAPAKDTFKADPDGVARIPISSLKKTQQDS